MSDYETVEVDWNGDLGVGTITLNRPDALNALNGQIREDVVAAMRDLEGHNEGADGVALRVVVLEGAGDRAFSAGADIGEFSDDTAGATSERRMFTFVREFPTPVVSKIDGFCLGGGFELALATDFRLASESSRFGLPEVNLGLFPGAGAVQYITKLAGPGLAKEIAMSGEHFEPHRLSDAEVIHDVYPDEEFDERVDEFVADLAGQAPLALQTIKESATMATQVGLREGIAHDATMFDDLLGTEDFQEGAAAFSEDREPEFEGK
jgi:enoyl-CoA hydratase/carnithine racemase